MKLSEDCHIINRYLTARMSVTCNIQGVSSPKIFLAPTGPEYVGKFLHNVSNNFPIDIASYLSRLKSSSALL
jgi:hypothetical protein